MVARTQIEFYPSGAVILSEEGGPVTFLRVIHSGGVDIVHGEELLDLLGPVTPSVTWDAVGAAAGVRGARDRGHALLPHTGGGGSPAA